MEAALKVKRAAMLSAGANPVRIDGIAFYPAFGDNTRLHDKIKQAAWFQKSDECKELMLLL